MHNPDFHTLHDILVRFTERENELAAVLTRLNARAAEAGTKYGAEIIRLETERDSCAAQARAIIERHPEWFSDSKTLKLPCGTVKSTSTTRIVPVLSEADALERLKASDHPALCAAVRIIESLDLEVLGAFDDSTLAGHGLRREKTESITITAAKAPVGEMKKAARATAAPAQAA